MERCLHEAVDLPGWRPTIIYSDGVSQHRKFREMRRRAPEAIKAPAITYSAQEPLLVSGERFVLVSERSGLVEQSLYLNDDAGWFRLIGPNNEILPMPDRPILVAGNRGWKNYYHWTFQCLASVMLAKDAGFEEGFFVVVPELGAVMRDGLRLCGIDAARIVELPSGSIALPGRAFYSNVLDGTFAFDPHPAMIEGFERLAARASKERYAGRNIYLARTDSPNRVMVNEAKLIDVLERRGFMVVATACMALDEQMAIFREAKTIVAPHGAGLTNLLFATSNGPLKVVELLQENYLGRAFLKICQAKGLDYTAIVNPVRELNDGRHASTWTCDIPALLRILDDRLESGSGSIRAEAATSGLNAGRAGV